MAGLISREELLEARQKKSPKKPHLTLTEKYDICCLADESPLSNEDFGDEWVASVTLQGLIEQKQKSERIRLSFRKSLHHHLLVNRCSDLGKPLHHHILMKSNTAFINDGSVAHPARWL